MMAVVKTKKMKGVLLEGGGECLSELPFMCLVIDRSH